jgi:glycosyltransferase involved in cell wall biosynthesis
LRLAVYTDYVYRRSRGLIYADRAFALFLARLSEDMDGVVIAGKVDPAGGPARYPLSSNTTFVELPYYSSLASPRQASIGMARSLRVFWRLLGEVDGVWLLGPHPLALAFAALAAARGRSVALGVRQDFPTYVRARHPRRRWMHMSANLLEGSWRLLAGRVPIVAVGSVLAARYPPDHTLEISVSLVRDEDIAPPELARRRSYTGGELRVLSVGRLEEEKNPLMLADVMAILLAHEPRWRLLVCGEGPLAAALAERCRELGVSDQVDLLGYVAHDDGLRQVYRDCHALLHVSWTEGVPQVLYEAFAARLPVVATAVGGVRTAAGDAALLVEPGDPQAAATMLERVCTDAELRNRLTDAGVERVKSTTLDVESRRVAEFLSSRGARRA